MKKWILTIILISSLNYLRAEESDTLWTKNLFGNGNVINALFSPDDKTIFVSTTENFLELDALTGNIIRKIPEIRGMERFVENYRYFISYDMKKYTFPEMQLVKDYDYIYKLASLKSYDFIKDGSIVIYINSIMNSVDNSYPMHIFDAKTNELLFKFKSQESFHQIQISPDGKSFVTTSSDLVDIPNPNDNRTYLRFWDMNNFKEIKKIEIGPIGLGALKFSPNGKYLGIGGGTHIYLYDTQSWLLLDTFNFEGMSIYCYTFSNDSQYLYLINDNGGIEIYQIQNKKFIKSIGPKWGSAALTISGNNNYIVGFGGSYVILWPNTITEVIEPKLSGIIFYPNPVKNTLTLQNTFGIIKNATLSSVIGTVLNNNLANLQSDNTIQFDFSNLTTGTYFLALYSDNQAVTVKFIKE